MKTQSPSDSKSKNPDTKKKKEEPTTASSTVSWQRPHTCSESPTSVILSVLPTAVLEYITR